MRTLATLTLLCTLSHAASADTFVYFSLAGEKKIAVYALDSTEGKLNHRADVKTDGEPGALTIDPRLQYLLAAMRSAGTLSSFQIDRTSGRLTHVNTVPAGSDPAHIATDRTGRFLLTAYYVAAKVTVHSISTEGKLSEQPVQSLATADKAHAILPDPSNRFVFVPHTGPNAIFQFTFQADAGKLTASTTPRLTTPDGAGPRHIVFHPSRDIAYVDYEQGGSVSVYALDTKTGTLKPLQTISTLPADFKGKNATAEIKIHPSGKFLYVSNRGHDSIACFKVDDQDGKLTALGQEPTEKTPRSFDLDPSGKFLLAAGEASGRVAVYRINPDNGALRRLHTVEVGKQPWWVMAVDLPGGAAEKLPANTWTEVKPEFKLPEELKDGRWLTGDGFSDSVYRSKTGSILIRTGIESKTVGYSPGFYTNTTVEWDPRTDKSKVLEISNWGGGSYSAGKLLPGFKEQVTPMPRHTYDGICYVEEEDAMYMMLGAHGRSFSKEFDDATKEAYSQDVNSTWKLNLATGRWTRIPESVRKFWNENTCSPYESHLQHWPAGNKLLFLDDRGTHAAEFDLKTQQWDKVEMKDKPPMSLYNARSTWDSKRQLWIFRLGPSVCSYDPRTREFKSLLAAYPNPEDKKDIRNAMKGITYIAKHDVYLINGLTAEDTWVYAPEKGTWSELKAAGPKLINGYLQYDPKSDQVILSYQLSTFRLRYEP